ncbi:DUF4177 domain-containing protein [Maritimibacter alkaliphilus]|uniref:DUF4177 domain-containing protein n=1 Tax=Maritimibacter alkaliphilus TaxID=404236 RepID=UPI001C9459A9|nr:DUF4177 domain-containing protein [Maritimibacter alkaliphilus]MBY6090195.1 DUF4177 domain-containing protein [Maritimibacter alkaliphilus]
MTRFEYKVVPAPVRGQKAKGVKTPESRFAHALEQVMNDMAAEGWEYLRAETLPSEERSGFTSTTTTYRNVLVFRRPRPADAAPFQPELLETGAPKPILVAPTTPSETPAARPEVAQEQSDAPPASDVPATAEPESVAPQTGADEPTETETRPELPDTAKGITNPAPSGDRAAASGKLGPAGGPGGPSPALGGASRSAPAALDRDNGVEDTDTLDAGFSDMLRRRAAQVMGRSETPDSSKE